MILFVIGLILVGASLGTAHAADVARQEGRDGPVATTMLLFIFGFCGVMFGAASIWPSR